MIFPLLFTNLSFLSTAGFSRALSSPVLTRAFLVMGSNLGEIDVFFRARRRSRKCTLPRFGGKIRGFHEMNNWLFHSHSLFNSIIMFVDFSESHGIYFYLTELKLLSLWWHRLVDESAASHAVLFWPRVPSIPLANLMYLPASPAPSSAWFYLDFNPRMALIKISSPFTLSLRSAIPRRPPPHGSLWCNRS